MTSLGQWLNKLESNNQAIKLGLDNIKKASTALNLSKPASYVITVAGTNGKGSVVRLLESIFTDLGFNTGCYTSPHLINFNERLCVNKQALSDQEIINCFEYVEANIVKQNINLTFFEFITASAWFYFQSMNLDIVILEIGLGGRLDAVNAIPKDLAIITSIDFDHQHYLGNSWEKIGAEKAGIINQGCSVILGDSDMPYSVKSVALANAKDWHQYMNSYNLLQSVDNSYDFIDGIQNINVKLNKDSGLKINNIATAIKALTIVDSDFRACLDSRQLNETLANFNLVGRCSWVDPAKTLLLDVAHNIQSVSNLASYISVLKRQGNKKIIAFCGMLNDKDSIDCLKLMKPVVDTWNFVTIDGVRGSTALELSSILKKLDEDISASLFDDFEKCGNLIRNLMRQNIDRSTIIVVFGSFHVVGPIYKYITS